MSSSRRSTRSGTRGYAHLVEIDVPVGRVWRALTEPPLIRIWSGQQAEIDPRKGGFYRLGNRNEGGREAHIDIFDVDRRLRIIYLNDRGAPIANGVVVDDFLLDMRRGPATASLRLLGSGIPDTSEWDNAYLRMRMNWERFLGRIKAMLEAPPIPKKPPPPPKDPPLPGLDY